MLAVVGIGANLGTPFNTVKQALLALEDLGESFRASSLYQTPPVSPYPQPDYINAVCLFETDLPLTPLFEKLQAIEKWLGKVKKGKEMARFIDLDLLFYGESSYEENGIIIPHPRWKERLFVLIPLSELFEEVKVEEKIYKMSELIAQFPDGEIEKIKVIHGESRH